jgi:uncharacterized DUF497 family protein
MAHRIAGEVEVDPDDIRLYVARRETLGLDFADAEQVFSGPCVTFEDSRFDYGEDRLIALGLLAGRVVMIAHAPRGEVTTRIISMRKANRLEQKIYQERLDEG